MQYKGGCGLYSCVPINKFRVVVNKTPLCAHACLLISLKKQNIMTILEGEGLRSPPFFVELSSVSLIREYNSWKFWGRLGQ